MPHTPEKDPAPSAFETWYAQQFGNPIGHHISELNKRVATLRYELVEYESKLRAAELDVARHDAALKAWCAGVDACRASIMQVGGKPIP